MTHHSIRRFAAATALALYAALGLTIAAPAQAADRPALTVANAARGKYLVSTSGCMDCHTPMKMGANGPEWDMSRMLSGHPDSLQMPPVPALPEGPWLVISSATNTAWAGPWGVSFTANLTPDPETGVLRDFTEEQFIQTMRTGRHQGRGRKILPPMPWDVYAKMTDEDLKSVFAYLRQVPPVKNKVPDPLPPAN